jgi:CubicO group peptidase (beta-lactamase class C family)
MIKPLNIILGILFLLTACTGSPPIKPDTLPRDDYSYLKAHLSWMIEEEMANQNVEGLSIAIVDDQQIVWSQGFGFADKANKIKASAETVYRVGSISKLFTDTLVMQLAEQGRLDIDKPLKTYLPNFSIKTRFPDAGPITLRNIMTHHSGLPGDVENGFWTENPTPLSQLVESLKDDYVAYPPNTILAYSNLGITLLGAMLQEVTNEDFSLYAEQQLLKPLKMTNASFSSALKGEFASKAYLNHDEKTEIPLRDIPAGGLNANVLDLSRFVKMVLTEGKANGQQIIKPETLKEMLRPQNKHVELDMESKIGLGWFSRDNLNIGTIVGHGGAVFYHRSLLSVSPEHKLGVVILSNSPADGNLISKITNTALKLAVEIKTGREQPVDTDKPKVATRALTPQELEKFAGQYVTNFGYFNVIKKGDKLVTEIEDRNFEIVAREDGQYDIRYKFLGLIPLQPEELKNTSLSLRKISGHELILIHKQDKATIFGEKIKPTPISKVWKNRLGEYTFVNIAKGEGVVPKNAVLREQDGILRLKYSIPDFGDYPTVIPIDPISENEAIILGIGRSKQETIRIVKLNGKEHIAYSGYLLQKK